MLNVILGNTVISGIELFVFDKDGTLIDLYNYWCNMIKLRAERMCRFYSLPLKNHRDNLMFEMGIDLKNRRLRQEGPVGLLPREVVQKAAENYLHRLNCKGVTEACFKIFKEVDELSLSLLPKFIRPLKGAIDLLMKIRRKNGKIAIATTDKTERAEIALDFLKIGGLISLVVGADKVGRPKPAPDILNFIGRSLNIPPSNSIMIGDAKTDIQMGTNANFKACIGITGGLTNRDELSGLTPYVIEDIRRIRIEPSGANIKKCLGKK